MTQAEQTGSGPAVYNDVLEMIGSTPMLRVTHIDTGPCELFLKMEQLNPGNSIKDRIALSMIEAAEETGQLKPGGHIIEATAGNTGISLALIGALRGYRTTVVVPDKMSDGKISHLRAMGATVVLTRSDVGKGHPEYYQDVAERLAKEDSSAIYVNQFSNPANPIAHESGTGPEIWSQMNGDIDALVAGIGSAGTMTGLGRYFKSLNPEIEIILADPVGSILTDLINEGVLREPGTWLVEGIGEDFVPDIAELDHIDRAIAVSDHDSFHAARDLLKNEGVLAGSSTGTLLSAALTYCREQTQPRRVVTFVCDHGAKYLSKMFNDHWMTDQGYLQRQQYGDLRDLIARRHDDHEDYTATPATPLKQVIRTMHLNSISQMAIVDDAHRIVGIIDESDVLMALTKDNNHGNSPASEVMTSRLETLPPSAAMSELLPIFRSDRVVIVADDDQFYGLITKIDFIHSLRSKLA